jgi:glycosyltransferase involved in cell wall biosynthesis
VTPHAAPYVSAVVPVYNDAGMLRHTLAHLAAQTLEPDAFEVVVVDDGSTDDTPQVLAAATTSRVRVRGIRLQTNRGRSAARNAGIRTAAAPLIVFVDSDVLVKEDFLMRHLEMHRSAGRPAVGRGPVVTIPTPEIPRRTPLIRHSPAYLSTANASVARQALFEAGLFDEGFQPYGWEDFDLGLRLKARGLPRLYSRQAVAYHVEPPLAPDAFDRYLAKEEARAQTALYLLNKHPDLATRILVQDTLVHRAIHLILAGGGLLDSRRAPRLARWLQARGYRGLALLVARGLFNRHYIQSLARFRAEQGGLRQTRPEQCGRHPHRS